jgi:type II secretory ATPase GspE/PulE/Tfp pilus assembly ATPase PilB-like protein
VNPETTDQTNKEVSQKVTSKTLTPTGSNGAGITAQSTVEATLKNSDQVVQNETPVPTSDTVTNIQLYRGKGGKECNSSGYWGRVGIFEVLPVTEKISRLILEHSPASDIEKQARMEGMITLKQDGYLKVLEGATTMEEVIRVAQE